MEFSGENDTLHSLDHVPGLGLQSSIFGAGLHASVAEFRHLFVEYSKINGHGHAWTGHAVSVSGNQVLLNETGRFGTKIREDHIIKTSDMMYLKYTNYGFILLLY